jgi:hypothetical protein
LDRFNIPSEHGFDETGLEGKMSMEKNVNSISPAEGGEASMWVIGNVMNKLSDNESCSVVEFEPDTTSEQTQSECDDTIENSNEIITDEIVPDNDTTNTNGKQ